MLSATYDGLQRLAAVTETPGTAFGYSYDLASNRTDVLSNGVPLAHYDYDAADQVVGWGYDAAVNLLADGTRTALDLLGRNAASGRGRFHLTGQV